MWYDDLALQLGDSIRRAIDKGLAQSRFGVVVLSPAFFSKTWPQYELDGLAQREMRGNDRMILPIWHNVDYEDVFAYSAPLAGKRAARSNEGLASVAAQILSVVRPQGSPLIVARDVLLQWGVTPPVITDSYWLDVVEASNRLPGAGAAIPQESHWGRWSFPLPLGGDNAEARGERLAWTAMQLAWTAAADERSISPLSHPDAVHEFIHDHSGLWETCAACPDLLAEYAPQLTIRGFEGDLLDPIEEGFAESCRRSEAVRRISSTSGTATTVDGSTPACDEEWTVRHPEFGRFEPAYVANAYFAGGIFGPEVSPYEHADHLFWLLSDASKWLPPQIRKVLIEGMATWGVWHWTDGRHINDAEWPEQGEMFKALQRTLVRRDGRFVWNKNVRKDLRSRIEYSIDLLSLPNTPDSIIDAFMREQIVEKRLADQRAHRAAIAKREAAQYRASRLRKPTRGSRARRELSKR